jgi:hypothetical protein
MPAKLGCTDRRSDATRASSQHKDIKMLINCHLFLLVIEGVTKHVFRLKTEG